MPESLTAYWRTTFVTDQTVPDYQGRGDFTPTLVEWRRDRSWHPTHGYSDSTKIAFSRSPEPGFHLVTAHGLDFDDVPDWVPRPPDGWDSAVRTHVVAVTA